MLGLCLMLQRPRNQCKGSHCFDDNAVNVTIVMKQGDLKNENNCLNTNIYSYLGTSGSPSSNLYLNVVNFLTPVFIGHLCQLKTVVFLHWCLICAVLL